MDDLYLHVQLVQSEARLAVEDGLEVGNGEEEDRPELDAQMRSPPVLQATKTPTSVRVVSRRRRSERPGWSACSATTSSCRASAAMDAIARTFYPPAPL
jgi:hypothetical protein